MKAYRAIVSARFRMLLQYRAAAAAGVATQLFWGLIRVMIFTGFYHAARGEQPMSLPQVVSYIWLGQALLGLMLWGSDTDVGAMMRTGTVAYELARPVDLYCLWLARALATRLAVTLPRCVPILVFSELFFGLGLPPDGLAAIAFLAAVTVGFLLAASISVLATITLIWTVAGEGVGGVLWTLSALCSGLIVPLPLLPDWAQGTLSLLPFRGLLDTPSRIWTGQLPPAEAAAVIAQQLVWVGVLVLIGRALVARATKRLVVQGG